MHWLYKNHEHQPLPHASLSATSVSSASRDGEHSSRESRHTTDPIISFYPNVYSFLYVYLTSTVVLLLRYAPIFNTYCLPFSNHPFSLHPPDFNTIHPFLAPTTPFLTPTFDFNVLCSFEARLSILNPSSTYIHFPSIFYFLFLLHIF